MTRNEESAANYARWLGELRQMHADVQARVVQLRGLARHEQADEAQRQSEYLAKVIDQTDIWRREALEGRHHDPAND
ncbi:hypothetical protein [Cupriavidus pauculus]|uniref:hypothetical protein n=2 Tax=Cupriavidus pauculus TaxID=82633 RepID=UPI001D0C00D4|nr:hypothetical protein [Cupriavidus pauculus]UAL03861.1 hypothetical protein K8O84_28495 [Cupriavidus pauculus]